jgi:glucosamine-6-phosphate deaminase
MELSAAAAAAVAVVIRSLIAQRNRAIGIFASDPWHSEFLDELVKAPDIEWTRVIGFHLNEYLGIGEEAPNSLRRFLLDRLVKRVPIAEFHPIRGEAANPEAACVNYAALLKSRPPDFAVLGIGPNGSLGSIDQRVCDYNDPAAVKVIEPDDDHLALSLTIPTILGCRTLFAMAYGSRNQDAIRKLIEGEISPACPASVLRRHLEAHLFLGQEQ